MGCCAGCARAILISFNFLFWLSGAAILGVGIWMLADENISSYFKVVQIDSNESYFKYAAYIFITFGCFIFLVGFAGCCGAIRKSKVLLGLYIFSLMLIFAGELAAGIVMVIYRLEMKDKFRTILTDSVKDNYGKSDQEDITAAWNLVQVKEECCGANGYKDYENMTFESTEQEFPVSCCVLANREHALTKLSDAHPLNTTKCFVATPGFFHEKDCEQKLYDWITTHSAILIGVGFGIAAIQILGVIFAICVWRDIDKEKY